MEGNFARVLSHIAEEVKDYAPSLLFVDSFRSVVQSAKREEQGAFELQRFVQQLGLQMTSWQATTFLIGEYLMLESESSPVFTVADGILWLSQNLHRNSMVRKMQVVKMRGQAQAPGLHTFRISDEGIQVFPRAIIERGTVVETAIKVATGEERLPMGIPGLDEMLGGGLPVGYSLLVVGPSGSGKSTLLNIIGMLDEANEGEYHFLHEAVHKLKEREKSGLYKQYIGFVFQAYHLIDELTVYENIETPLIYQNIKTSERKAMVADILDRFQIVGKKDLFPTQLSGGQQQLVGIARALISKPKLILADEPTGNLNSKQGEEIMGLFSELNKEGVTIIQVTHSEKNAGYGTRIINLLDGMVANHVTL